jgi:rod shape-determining protein MreD
MAITDISREQVEVYRFSIPVSIGLPLVALFLQAFLPRVVGFFSIFDLPLLVTIFFAVARRNQISGLLTGGVIGILQDSLAHRYIGLYGIAKTVVGYVASSLGVKLDIENPGARLMVTFGFYIVHEVIYFIVARVLVQQAIGFRWAHVAFAALCNAALAVLIFGFLDRFKQRS